MYMKNTLLKWTALFIVLFFSISANSAEIQIYHTDFSDLQVLTNAGAPATVSSDGSFEIIKGATTASGGSVSWATTNTSYFLTSSSAGQITFNNLALNNGGRIVVKWGSGSSRALFVNSGKTLNTTSPDIGTHATLASADRSKVITDNFTIPSSLTGATSISLGSSGGGGVYIFEITVYTNSKGPIVDAFTLVGAAGTVDVTTGAITVTVPYATNLTSLVPTFTLATGTSFVTASDATTPKDFTSDVTYQFTDGTDVKNYTVHVTKVPASTEKDILSFSVPNQVGSSDFIAASGLAKDSIIVTVPYSTTDAQLQSLVPTYTISDLATCTPTSGTANDFTNPTSYIVTAESGAVKEYVVRVKRAPASSACSITNFSLNIADEQVQIDATNKIISVKVGAGDVLTGITPSITKSPQSTITSPTFPQNFSSPVDITVKAEDGTTKTYKVTVVVDGTAPVLTSSVPSNNATGVSLAGVITLNYDENIKLNLGGLSLSGGGVLGTPTIINSIVSIPFSGLSSLTDYTLTIPAGAFSDIFGNASTLSTVAFKTAKDVNETLPYYTHMTGATFEMPAFISGGTYDATADVKATTTTQYGAYKLNPGDTLWIKSKNVDSVYVNVYAPGPNRTYSIGSPVTADVTTGTLTNYLTIGTSALLNVNYTGTDTTPARVYITNTSVSGAIYIPYIYMNAPGQQTLTEKQKWCATSN